MLCIAFMIKSNNQFGGELKQINNFFITCEQKLTDL